MLFHLLFLVEIILNKNKMSKRPKNSLAGNRKRQYIFRQVNSIVRREQSERMNYTRTDTRDDSIQRPQSEIIIDSLRLWAIQYGITLRALSALLKILISAGLWYLKSDARTLLKTPRTVSLADVCGGKYWYSGIRANIQRLFIGLKKSITIKLGFNIDGLPLHKSSKVNFWPILGHVFGMSINSICLYV